MTMTRINHAQRLPNGDMVVTIQTQSVTVTVRNPRYILPTMVCTRCRRIMDEVWFSAFTGVPYIGPPTQAARIAQDHPMGWVCGCDNRVWLQRGRYE